ncbi:hypothetical protein MMC06_005972 [Schaereria dolodes]|nr:hypothetical protein [Schaereria dolodes]
MSHSEEDSRTSPFTIRKEDLAKLDSSQGFQIVRKLLTTDRSAAFCEHHSPSTEDIKQAWLLHRDITHAIIMPVLEIYRQASQLAESFLCPRSIFDLELAFRGEARGAFSWLQCLIVEEEDWCSTRGCPACIVNYVLQSEPTIRLVLAACRLSRSLRKPKAGRNLPLFDFWRSSLRKVLDTDPFWGPTYSKDIEARAADLETGIQQLVRQCCELSEAVVVAAAPGHDGEHGKVHDRDLPDTKGKDCIAKASEPYHELAQRSVKIRASLTVKKHPSAIPQEEQSWLQKIVLGCWTTLLADAAEATRRAVSDKRPVVSSVRVRSLST